MEFVTKLNPQGTGLVYSTFLGATLNDVSDIKVDAQGGVYVSSYGGAELSEANPQALDKWRRLVDSVHAAV